MGFSSLELPVSKTSTYTVNYVKAEIARSYIDPIIYNDIEALAEKEGRCVDFDFDFRKSLSNKITSHGFGTDFLPVELVIEGIYNRNQFRSKQTSVVDDLLNKGEFLLRVTNLPDTIGIEKIDPYYLKHIAINPATDEVLSVTLQYLFQPSWTDKLLYFRKTWTPTEIYLWSQEEDEEDLEIVQKVPNYFGFVPFAYCKLGNKKRGRPVWAEVSKLVQRFNGIMNDIEDILIRNAEPTRVFKANKEPQGVSVGEGDAVWIERDDDVYYLKWEGTLEGYFRQTEEILANISEISEIPMFRQPSTAPDASGMALKERGRFFDAKTRRIRKTFCRSVEYLNKLIFAVMSVKYPKLFEFRLGNLEPLPKEDLCDSVELAMRMQGKEASNKLTPFDEIKYIPEINVSSITVEPITFPPLRQVSGEELARYAESLTKLEERGIITVDESRNILRGLGVFEEYQ